MKLGPTIRELTARFCEECEIVAQVLPLMSAQGLEDVFRQIRDLRQDLEEEWARRDDPPST